MELVPYFWGYASWPRAEYVRFADIKGLETGADHSTAIKTAFESLTNLNILGLSLNNGYGWLSGSDISDRAKILQEPVKIFGSNYIKSPARDQKWAIHSKRTVHEFGWYGAVLLAQYARLLNLNPHATAAQMDFVADFVLRNPVGAIAKLSRDELQRRVDAVVYNKEAWAFNLSPKSVRDHGSIPLRQLVKQAYDIHRPCLVIGGGSETELTALMSALGNMRPTPVEGEFTGRWKSPVDYQMEPGEALLDASVFWDELGRRTDYKQLLKHDPRLSLESTPGLGHMVPPAATADDPPPLLFDRAELDRSAVDPPFGEGIPVSKPPSEQIHFCPRLPTEAQLQWLAETEWAQRAFINSFNLAVIDSRPVMETLRSFTITNFSSSFLHDLDRSDMWKSLRSLETLILLVSADWRSVTRHGEHVFKDTEKRPSQAAEHFHGLLSNQVSNKPSIKCLTIGYIGGGEHATGMFARNQHILPAPVVSEQLDILVFPHVQRLTFTNCWFTSRTLLGFVAGMQNLQTLKLDSVSLLAFSGLTEMDGGDVDTLNSLREFRRTESATRIAFGVYITDERNFHELHTQTIPNFLVCGSARVSLARALASTPAEHTWLSVLARISPGPSLAAIRSACSETAGPACKSSNGNRIRNAGAATGAFRRLELVSCGYVKLAYQRLPREFDAVGPLDSTVPALRRRAHRLDLGRMQASDLFLGHIIPHLPAREQMVLEAGYGMRVGWGSDPARLANLEDGQPEGGSGRFSGVLEAVDTSPV
jgi:hypothetical protein